MSFNSTEPSILFGGTQERIKDRFILAAGDSYEAGATGGEEKHTLTESEMPLHGHVVAAFGNDPWLIKTGTGIGSDITARYHIEIPSCTNVYTEDTDKGYLQANENGGDQPHNNMPPYLVAYMWYRTA